MITLPKELREHNQINEGDGVFMLSPRRSRVNEIADKLAREWQQSNVILIGGIFLVAILSTLASGMVIGLNDRSVYLIAGVDIALGLGFITAWVRLEIIRNTIELLNNLRP